MFKNQKHFQKGLTLIELMAVIAIVSIIATLAAPNFSYLIKKRSADTSINNIYRNYKLARTTAVNLGVPITLCASRDNLNCNTSGGNYFISFIDTNADASADSSKNINNQIIRSTKIAKRRAFIKIKNFSGIKGTIQIQADGMTRKSMQTGSITYCSLEKPDIYGRMIAISRTGKARIRQAEEYDGKSSTGKPNNEPNIKAICS